MGTVEWTKAQMSAIDHKDSDLIISAAAGSGKSATLTERIIRKIKCGKDISKMLIVTFTKAATAELKNKISVALSEALKEEPTNSHISDQLLSVASADICTNKKLLLVPFSYSSSIISEIVSFSSTSISLA